MGNALPNNTTSQKKRYADSCISLLAAKSCLTLSDSLSATTKLHQYLPLCNLIINTTMAEKVEIVVMTPYELQRLVDTSVRRVLEEFFDNTTIPK